MSEQDSRLVRVLLVDDEREFVDTVAERLATRGVEAVVSYSGEEALPIAEKGGLPVVVLDLKMPGMDGLEVLRHLSRLPRPPQVIMLTGHGSSSEKKIAESIGIFDYLPKPQPIETLAERIRAAYNLSCRGERGQTSTGGRSD